MSYNKQARCANRTSHRVEIAKQLRLYHYHNPRNDGWIKTPGKYRKHGSLNCGRSRCGLCANPRHRWGTLPLKEVSENWVFKYELENL